MTWTGTTRKKHQTSTRQPFFSAPKAFGVNNRHHNPVLFWTALAPDVDLKTPVRWHLRACQNHNLSSQTFSEFAENAGRVGVIDAVTDFQGMIARAGVCS
jgi:hypothetical protein